MSALAEVETAELSAISVLSLLPAEPRAEAREPVLAELGWLREAVQELVQQRAEARPIVMTGSPTAGHEIQLWFGSQGPELDRRVRFDAEHLEPREAALVALEALRARTT